MARILLIEDNPSDALTVSFLLKKDGHEVNHVPNAIDGLQAIKSKPTDIVVLDWYLPHFSGIDFLKTIRKDPEYKATPIIMLSGRKELKDISSAIKEGVTDYIVKPVDSLIFKTKIDQCIKTNLKSQWQLFDIPNEKNYQQCRLESNIRLLQISELEVIVWSQQQLAETEIYSIQFSGLSELGINALSCRNKKLESIEIFGDINGYKYRMDLVGLTESDLSKIRIFCKSFVYNQTTTQENRHA